MNTLKIKKVATNALVFVATLIVCFVLLVCSCAVGGFTASIIAEAAIPDNSIFDKFYNANQRVYNPDDIPSVYFACQPSNWSTLDEDSYITPEWYAGGTYDEGRPEWLGQGFLLYKASNSNWYTRYYFGDDVTEIIYDYTSRDIKINGKSYWIKRSLVEDPNNPGVRWLYDVTNLNAASRWVDSGDFSANAGMIPGGFVFSSVPVYDTNGNLIKEGYEPFLFNPRVYDVQQPLNSYYSIGGYLASESPSDWYSGIGSWSVYSGKTSTSILFEQSSVITNPVVIDTLHQFEFTVDKAYFTTISPKELYQNSLLEFGQWYTAVLTVDPSYYPDNRSYIVGYWFFRYTSENEGENSQTNDFLNDDKYEDTAENIKDAINSNNDRIQNQFEQIGNISDNVNIDDIEGALNLEIDDSTSIYWFLRSLANSERVGYLLLVVITIGLLSYILFGKVN